MRRVLFKRYEDVNGRRIWSDFVYEGLFHAWGHEDNGYGSMYSVAIIELPDGRVETVLPERIKFIS